jgi:hypothetical protein
MASQRFDVSIRKVVIALTSFLTLEGAWRSTHSVSHRGRLGIGDGPYPGRKTSYTARGPKRFPADIRIEEPNANP